MLFHSFEFFPFLFLVFTMFWLLPRLQVYTLALASLVFYAAWDWRFLALLVGSISFNFLSGILIEKQAAGGNRQRLRLLLTAAIAGNLAVLGFFKYFQFFYQSLCDLFGLTGAGFSTLQIILPLGISFFTFQAMAYLIDIYRGRTKAERNPVLFGLFLSFFPQLIAGPIERSQQLIPQLARRKSFSEIDFSRAFTLFMAGVLLKAGVADHLKLVVDAYFSDVSKLTSIDSLAATYGFTFQIYVDFFGYTLMARGLALLFAVRLSRNFEQPFFARTPREFWQRWHITLSSWFRDYLYIPLGGRDSIFALFFTMAVAGLWHGAAGAFIFWGLVHATLLLGYRYLNRRLGVRSLTVPVNLTLVALLFVFFRADSVMDGWLLIQNIFNFETPTADSITRALWCFYIIVPVLLIELLQRHWPADWRPFWLRPLVRAVGFSVFVVVIDAQTLPFIYFQF